MAEYRINGYELYSTFGFIPDGERVTANSFEILNTPKPTPSYDWEDENGIEYNLLAPTLFQPKVFTLKGALVLNTIDDYKAARIAINTVFTQNYVTLESMDLGIKVNAKLKPGSITWERKTNMYGKIIVFVQFQFDEVMDLMPFKDESAFSFDVNIERDLISTIVDNTIYRFYLNNRGELIMTTG